MAEDSYIDVARQRRTVNKLKELIDKKADVDSIASDVFVINLDKENMTADKTYQEILDAYNAGKYLLLRTSEGRTALWDFSYSWGFSFSDYSRRSWSSLSSDSETIGLNKYTEYQLTTQNKWTRNSVSYQTWKGSKDVFDIEGLNHIVTLKDSAITTAKLADGSVTKAKLGSDVVIPENAAEVFTITVSDMTAEDTWNHDKTWSEINEAYLAGKILQVKYTEAEEQYLNWCSYSNNCFYFANYDPQEDSNILIEIDPDDTAHVTRPSSLPVATASTLGGVKVGDGLSVTNDGVLSVSASQTVVISPTNDKLTTEEQTKLADNWPNVTLCYEDNFYYYPNAKYDSDYIFINSGVVVNIGTGFSDFGLPGLMSIRIDTDGNVTTSQGQVQIASPSQFGVIKCGDEFTIKRGDLTIKNSAITADKIADGAITANKIADGAIGTATEATLGGVYASVNSSLPNFVPLGQVSSQKNEGLVISHINNGVIGSEMLADNAVTTDKIANGAITADKLASGVGGGATLTPFLLKNPQNVKCGNFHISSSNNTKYSEVTVAGYSIDDLLIIKNITIIGLEDNAGAGNLLQISGNKRIDNVNGDDDIYRNYVTKVLRTTDGVSVDSGANGLHLTMDRSLSSWGELLITMSSSSGLSVSTNSFLSADVSIICQLADKS